MKIVLLGAAGFIGTNLTRKLAQDKENQLLVVDQHPAYFAALEAMGLPNVTCKAFDFDKEQDMTPLFAGQDIVYHLISTTAPGTPNRQIPKDMVANVVVTTNILDACVRCKSKRVVFISSGGTVYGKEGDCPLSETAQTYPISSYGIQKITIEKLLYFYEYMFGLDYRVVRLANPYGPYQRPNGVLGAVTTFVYKALRGEEITVYGDGSVVRDFLYIDDAVRGILNIAQGVGEHRTFNLGSGYGTSLRQVLETLAHVLGRETRVVYQEGRRADVPVNFLDISRYERAFGKLAPLPLGEGILQTAEFLKAHYGL